MANKGGKIAAFTMIDVISGMVITSIIISMVFYLFMAINKQVADYGQVRNELNRFLLMRTDLKRQFEAEEKEITGVPGGILLSSHTQDLSYLKEGSLLLRIQGQVIDTMSNSLEEFKVEFVPDKKGLPTNKVKFIDLKVLLNDQPLSCQIEKDYGLIEVINQNLVHEL